MCYGPLIINWPFSNIICTSWMKTTEDEAIVNSLGSWSQEVLWTRASQPGFLVRLQRALLVQPQGFWTGLLCVSPCLGSICLPSIMPDPCKLAFVSSALSLPKSSPKASIMSLPHVHVYLLLIGVVLVLTAWKQHGVTFAAPCVLTLYSTDIPGLLSGRVSCSGRICWIIDSFPGQRKALSWDIHWL